MCFSVAVVKNGVLMTAEEYYNSLPANIRKKKKNPIQTEIPENYFVSGFSHPKLAVITQDEMVCKEWGLIPDWASSRQKADELKNMTLNAVSETIFEKPSFRKSILSKRCLLPVSGFFEWREFHANKYPYYIHPLNAPGFLLASVFDSWRDNVTGETFDTFSIVTTRANTLMEEIHNTKKRMPLILDYDAANQWLDASTSIDALKSIMIPYDDNKMSAHTITKLAGSSKMDRNFPEILQPVIYPELNQQTLF